MLKSMFPPIVEQKKKKKKKKKNVLVDCLLRISRRMLFTRLQNLYYA